MTDYEHPLEALLDEDKKPESENPLESLLSPEQLEAIAAKDKEMKDTIERGLSGLLQRPVHVEEIRHINERPGTFSVTFNVVGETHAYSQEIDVQPLS